MGRVKYILFLPKLNCYCCEGFWVVGKPNPRLPSGSLKNSWCKHCMEGHQKLQQVLRRKAPVEWNRALLVALYKAKGERKVRDSYRGISLLSIPGMVYVLVILAKISSHISMRNCLITSLLLGRGGASLMLCSPYARSSLSL